MIETSFINPFSFEAKEIVRKLGQIENLDKKNDSLIDIIKHTHSQKLSSIPETLEQLALHKFQWYLDKKTDNFDDKVYEYWNEDFWGTYNIIEPTESLEHAVHKLKKQSR